MDTVRTVQVVGYMGQMSDPICQPMCPEGARLHALWMEAVDEAEEAKTIWEARDRNAPQAELYDALQMARGVVYRAMQCYMTHKNGLRRGNGEIKDPDCPVCNEFFRSRVVRVPAVNGQYDGRKG